MDTKKEMKEKILDLLSRLHKAEENSYSEQTTALDTVKSGMKIAQYAVASSQLYIALVLLEMIGAEIHLRSYDTIEVKDWGILED